MVNTLNNKRINKNGTLDKKYLIIINYNNTKLFIRV